jgi:mono/diheme cytochrome c family protein
MGLFPLTISGLAAMVVVSAPVAADEASSEKSNQAAHQATIEGEKLFVTTCSYCHEKGGREQGKGPKLAGSKRTDEFIINRITHGKLGAMPAFGGALSEDQIKDLVAYIRSLEP